MKRIKLKNIYSAACLSAYVLLTACSQNLFRVGPPPADEFTDLAQTYFYECQGGYHFAASIDNQQAWLFLPERTVSIMHISAASGMKYKGEQVMFWSKAQEATLEIDNAIYKGCKNNRSKAIWEHAKLNGIDFRALGNEPSWVLEIITGEHILFKKPLAGEKLEFNDVRPKIDQSAQITNYTVQENGHTFSLEIHSKSCSDSMSGEIFAATVSIILDGSPYKGCGRALH